ncbi:MAG: hypothetical protein NVSMB47_08280 [Polyangiales bacterium]
MRPRLAESKRGCEPILALETASREQGLPLIAPRLGQAVDVTAIDELAPLDAWWREVAGAR